MGGTFKKRSFFFFWVFITVFSPALYASPKQCASVLLSSEVKFDLITLELAQLDPLVVKLFKAPIRRQALRECEVCQAQTPEQIAAVAREVADDWIKKSKTARAYSFLIGAMVGSAALTTQITSSLPPTAQFLSHLVSQISTLGVFVLGGPIWTPISSKLTRWAFGVSESGNLSDDSAMKAHSVENLEKAYLKAYSTYSPNAQIAGQRINSFIMTAQQNFAAAYAAMNEPDTVKGYHLAIDQIAAAAVRMRRLFRDISPTDENIVTEIRTSFTRHVTLPELAYQDALSRVKLLDSESQIPEVASYYEKLLGAWLIQK